MHLNALIEFLDGLEHNNNRPWFAWNKPAYDILRQEFEELVTELIARVTAFDPVVRGIQGMPYVGITEDPYEAADGADALVLVTDWPALRTLDLTQLRSRMRGDLLVDGRNVFHPDEVARAGLVYEGLGRGALGKRRRLTLDWRAPWPAEERSREAADDEQEAVPGRRVS